MKISFRSVLTAAAALALYGCISVPQAKAQAASATAQPIVQMATHIEGNFLALAKAIPADKYDFAPSKEIFKAGSPAEFATVRTVAQQLTHVAGMPYRMLASSGVKPDHEVDFKALNAMTSKDEIVKALQASFDYQNKVLATLTPEKAFAPTGMHNMSMISMLLMMFNDYGDHYGQLVEYGRMNGIIPPATARQMQMHHGAGSKM
ncbi:MAG: DinB family protein [Acidobacteriota bacterium]